MYTVTQKNPNGNIISKVTIPMTCFQACNWIDEVKNNWLLDNINRGRENPISILFWLKPQTKEDIFDRLMSEADVMKMKDVYSWYYYFAKDFEEFWEDYV